MTPDGRRTDYWRHRPRGRGRAGVTIAVAAVLAGLGLAVPDGSAAAAPARPMALPAPGAANALVRVGQATMVPASARDLGTAPPDGQLPLDLVLKPCDPAALTEYATAVSTPGSPLYRDYLPRGEFGPEFGPAAATIAAVREAVTGLGLRAGQPSSGGLLLPVTGTVAQIDGYDLATGLGTPEAANLAQSLCGGSYWTPQTTITSPLPMPTPNGDSPATAAYSHLLYIAYTDTKDHIDYETFNGNTWSIPFIVEWDGVAASTTRSPGIAVSDGTVWVAWTTDNGKVDASSLRHEGWTAPVVVGAGKARSSAGPALAAGGGAVLAAWKGRNTDSVYLSIYKSTAWRAQLKVPGASTPSRPAITYYPSAKAIVIAWRTTTNTMKYEVYGTSGFGRVATIPGGTNTSPALTVLGKRLYAAWKGTTADRIFFSWQPEGKLSGSWSAQAVEPQAQTLGFPQIAGIRATLFTVWAGKTGTKLWYHESDPPL